MTAHICNVYCRPAEGLCCEVHHAWGPLDDCKRVEMEQRRRYLCDAGRLYVGSRQIVRYESAPEVPSLPVEKWETYWAGLVAEDDLGVAAELHDEMRAMLAAGRAGYYGPSLVWFRNAFPSCREEEEVTTHG